MKAPIQMQQYPHADNMDGHPDMKDLVYDFFIEQSPGILWIADESLYLVYGNRSFHEHFGRMGRLPKEMIDAFGCYNLRLLAEGEQIKKNLAVRTADGLEEDFHVILYAVRQDGRRLIGGYAIKVEHNLTENRHLQQANQRLLNLIHTASDAIWEWDIKTGKVFRNQSLLDMIGYSDENSENLSWWLYQIHPDDVNRVYSEVRQIIAKKESSWTTTYRFRCNNGSYKHIANKGYVVYEYGFPVKVTGSLRDVTEVKQLESQLAEERLAKQKEISENVIRVVEREKTLIGHELHDNINQILSVIRLYLGLLNPVTDEEKHIKAKSLEQLNIVIDEIRSLSKELVLPYLKKKGLVDSINELVEGINISRAIKMEFIYDHQAYPVTSDKNVMLFRIIQEQLRNILKHSKATKAEINLSLTGQEMLLVVQDNGVGFRPDKLITGIGLSNIRERAGFYNGTVSVETAEGKGCRLTVTIPVY